MRSTRSTGSRAWTASGWRRAAIRPGDSWRSGRPRRVPRETPGGRRPRSMSAPPSPWPGWWISLPRRASSSGVARCQSFMGGDPDEVPDRYRLGCPTSLLPVGKPQLLLHGVPDRSVPPSLSEHYAETAVSLGDPARYVPLPGVSHHGHDQRTGDPVPGADGVARLRLRRTFYLNGSPGWRADRVSAEPTDGPLATGSQRGVRPGDAPL